MADVPGYSSVDRDDRQHRYRSRSGTRRIDWQAGVIAPSIQASERCKP